MAWNFNRSGWFGTARPFGWVFSPDKKEVETKDIINKGSITALDDDTTAQMIDSTYANVSAFNQVDNFQNQAQLINEFRAMSLFSEVDDGIDDIVNAIVSTDDDECTVNVNLEYIDLPDTIKNKIITEFDHVIKLLNFNMTAYEKVRSWYVDGRSIFQCIIDEDRPEKGILKLTMLDARAIRKFTEIRKEIDPDSKLETIKDTVTYYLYNPMYANDISASTATNNNQIKGNILQRGQTLRLSTDSVVFCHSGIVSPTSGIVLSHLEKARKPLNNLKMLEDAVVVYRITRAPSRRIFYIDVGSLPPKQAETYVQTVMNKYRNKMTYDPSSGTVKGTAHQVSMLEDYFLPSKDGGRGTKIDTLPDGEANNRLEDLAYFQKKLLKALGVPISRLEPDANIIFGGNGGGEISRDEWKFSKFVSRLRRRYSVLFSELLRRQLRLKNIVTEDDWVDIIEPKIRFMFAADGYMKEQSEADQLNQKIHMLGSVQEYVGIYFSKDWVQREILKMNDDEIRQMDKQIDKEIKKGLIAEPLPINDPGIDEDGFPILQSNTKPVQKKPIKPVKDKDVETKTVQRRATRPVTVAKSTD